MFLTKVEKNQDEAAVGLFSYTHRIHGAAIHGNMDPINIPQMLAYKSLYIYVKPVWVCLKTGYSIPSIG
jgi:hypothetical protein